MLLRPLLIVLAVLAALPASASAHAVVTGEVGRISWRSSDANSHSTLAVTVQGSRIRFFDPTEDGGMSVAGRGCDPGQADSRGFIIEVTCVSAGITELYFDMDGGDDKLTSDVNLATTATGGLGNDTLTTAGADDTLYGGGDGNDVLEPRGGADIVQGETGDDELKVRDGVGDQVVCGDGTDRVESDERDQIPSDGSCEGVNGAPTPPPGGGGGPSDAVAPRLELAGQRSQRVRRGRFTLRVGVDEPSTLALSAVVRVGGRSYRVRAPAQTADAPGVERLTVRLSTRLRSALRRARRVSARVTIDATDAAGNRGRLRATVRLRA